ncbi:MAG: AfsR/SARP family transcriptional regulator, partial [Verrucomicrobiota bacterium]
KASQMILECADSSVRLQAMLYLFLYFIWIGNFPKARGIVESARGWTASPASPPQRRILFHLFEARLLCGVAQFDDSIRSAGRGLEIASASGIHLWDFFLLAEQTSARLGKGDLDAADACLKQMAPFLGPGQTLNQAYFHHLRSWHAALEGDIPLALSLEKTADALVTECGAPCGMALGSVYMARLANEAGNPGEAENHLGRAERIARAMKSPILEYQCLLVRADIAFLRGDTPSGLAALRNAFSAGRERGYFHYDNWIPTFMTRLCVKALEEGVEVPYAQELVRKRNLVPACPPLEIESWPWPVAIYTLGRFEILKNGEQLIFPRKVQKRPLSLLKAIIAFGGKAVREAQIADAVWPELEGDMAIQSLAVALHRLRQLLGPEEAVQRQEGILGLDPRYCWVDAFAFDHLLAKAQSPGETAGSGCAVELQEKAVSLYRGPFLAEEPDRPWAISMRERLRSRYLLAVGRLGAHWLQAKEWEKARACYEQGLGVDNLAEEFYQSLMRCYLQDSRKAEALAVYRRLEKTFSSLGVEPSPKTRGLLNALRSP